MKTIKQTLMDRDGISADHADELISDARSELSEHLADGNFTAAEDICAIHFGLEPDYLMELIPI
jgi:hypothetical protein